MRVLPTLMVMTVSFFLAGAATAQPRIPGPGGGGGGGGGAPSPTTGMILKMTPEQLVPLLNEVGFRSEVRQLQGGDKMVYARFWDTDALWSGVTFGNCEKDGSGCRTLQFFANFGKDQTVDPSWMNAWNNRFYVVRTYKLVPQGDLIFEGDLMIFTGVTADYVKIFARFFKQVVDESQNFTGK
jgi:hypothetical protein